MTPELEIAVVEAQADRAARICNAQAITASLAGTARKRIRFSRMQLLHSHACSPWRSLVAAARLTAARGEVLLCGVLLAIAMGVFWLLFLRFCVRREPALALAPPASSGAARRPPASAAALSPCGAARAAAGALCA